LGRCFDSATFRVSDNGNLIGNQSFANLATAQAFFSNNNLIDIMLAGGLNNVQLAFDEAMSGGEGFSFDFQYCLCVYHALTSRLDKGADRPCRFWLCRFSQEGKASIDCSLICYSSGFS
jgi:hypothetical protein